MPLVSLQLLFSMVFLVVWIISILFFYADTYFPIWLSVASGVFISTCLFVLFKKKQFGALTLLFFGVYMLPFIHIPPYLWFDFNSKPLLMWGLKSKPYMLDERIIELTAMLGVTGAAGIAFGISLSFKNMLKFEFSANNDVIPQPHSMNLLIWYVWVIVGFVLSWISAPTQTIFISAYTSATSLHSNMNFDSAWLVSYVILTFTIIDSYLDRNPLRKELKLKTIFVVVAVILVWLQLLRGDRAALPWIFGLFILRTYWMPVWTNERRVKLPFLKISFVIFLLLVITMFVGALRSELTGADLTLAIYTILELFESQAIGLSNLLHGTWSAVLLTPLSVAGDHVQGLLNYKLGTTYVDIAQSIPPGFIADTIGYVRPLNSMTGLAWEMRYGQGGTHAIVAPFVNFGIFGVFIISAIWSFLLCHQEKKIIRRKSTINLSFLVIGVIVAPQFLWYGEKNLINAIILWLIFGFFYRTSLWLSRKKNGRQSFANL